MPETPAAAGPERISLIVFSGDFERVHYALATAAAAAAIGKASTLFFTGPAIEALLPPGPERTSGWCGLAGRNGRCGGEVDADFRVRGVAGFEELLAACVEMGVRLIVCEMGLRVEGLERAALRPDLPLETAGLATLLADASASGALTFI